MDSGDFVVRVECEAHRQLASLAMQPESGPIAVAVGGRAVERFDVAVTCGKIGEKLGRFRWRQGCAHLRVEPPLYRGEIACVEQINNVSSDDGVATGFYDANALRQRFRGLPPRLPVWSVQD